MNTMNTYRGKVTLSPALYRNHSSDPRYNAQRNLEGRTHYVTDATLRFHHSRIITSYVASDGLLFAIVESVGLDWRNTKRGFRYVIFDVFGTALSRNDLEHTWSKSDVASRELAKELETLDARQITRDAIAKQREWFERDMNEFIKNTGL